MITDVKYLESQFSDESASELEIDKIDEDALSEGFKDFIGSKFSEEISNEAIYYQLQSVVAEVSQEDLEKNKALKPVFVINTFTNTVSGNIIRGATGSKYSHALISTDMKLKHMYTFDYDEKEVVSGKSGITDDNIERYKEFKGAKMRVACIMVTPEIYSDINHSINYYVKHAKNTKYSFAGVFDWIKGSKELSSWKDLHMFCSEFVDAVLKHSKIDISGKSSRNTHPDDLGAYTMKNNVFKIYEGPIEKFDTEHLEESVNNLTNTIDYKNLFVMTDNSMKSKKDINLGKENRIGRVAKGIGKTILRRESTDEIDDENSSIDAVIAEIMDKEAEAFTNVFDIGKSLISEALALQEKSNDINYENPRGHIFIDYDDAEILSGDAIDVEIKNTLETFDIKRHKLLLESHNIVKDYANFVNCHFEKNIINRDQNGTPSYSAYFTSMADSIDAARKEYGFISYSSIRSHILDYYHKPINPDEIRQVVQMRIKYIEGINAILREMIKTNGQLLGINEQQIDALIKGLSSNETSGKTIGEIKDIIVKNKSKFIKQNGTILDLRPLGAGVYVGSTDDQTHQVDKDDDKLKSIIQRCLTYDLILNAHGGSSDKIDLANGEKEIKRIIDSIETDLKTKIHYSDESKRQQKAFNSAIKHTACRIIMTIYKDFINKQNNQLDFFHARASSMFISKNGNHLDRFIPSQVNHDMAVKQVQLIFKKYIPQLKEFNKKYLMMGILMNQDGELEYKVYEQDRSSKWNFSSIRYLDGKEYISVKEVLKMAKSKGFDKILLQSCNPAGLNLPKELTKNVTFGKHSVYKENYSDNNSQELYNESTTDEDSIYEFLSDFENDYRAIAESYNIDYDNDQVLNEMYNCVISGEYLAEITAIQEGKVSDVFDKLIKLITTAIGFVIKLVKTFITSIKTLVSNIKEKFSKKKNVKINNSPIEYQFISVNGNKASLTSPKKTTTHEEPKSDFINATESIAKEFRKNSDEQVKLHNSLKNECERAANKQSSIGEGYLGLYESTRVKSLINRNSNTIQQITSIIIPISNKAVNKRFNSVGNASVSNTMKKYSKFTNGILNSNFSDINTIKAEYNLPKDKEVFSKMGKEYQWNEDFSNELDKLTESIKRMPKIKEICSNVTWETHPNKFCICFHIKKQLLDYSSND